MKQLLKWALLWAIWFAIVGLVSWIGYGVAH